MLNGLWVCFCTIFGIYVIYERAVYFTVFFAVCYGLGMALDSISSWGYLNPLILMAWLVVVPGFMLSVRFEDKN